MYNASYLLEILKDIKAWYDGDKSLKTNQFSMGMIVFELGRLYQHLLEIKDKLEEAEEDEIIDIPIGLEIGVIYATKCITSNYIIGD